MVGCEGDNYCGSSPNFVARGSEKFAISDECSGIGQNSFEQSHWEFWPIPVQLIGQPLRFTVILILYLLGVHLPSIEFLPQVAGRRWLDKFVFVLVSDHWHLA